MTIQVVYNDDVYDFENGVGWGINTVSAHLTVYNKDDQAEAVFRNWDNVSRVSEEENTELKMFYGSQVINIHKVPNEPT